MEKRLEEMSVDELRILKESWYKEARERKIYEKVIAIAGAFGREGLHCDFHYACTRPGSDTPWFEITAFAEDGWATVYLGEKCVYSNRSLEKLFLPGPWADEIDELYEAAVEYYRNEALKREEAERRRLVEELTYPKEAVCLK